MPTPRAEWGNGAPKNKTQNEFNRAQTNFDAANKAAETAAEKLRQFNKQFFSEYKQTQASGGTGSRPSTAREPKYKQSSAGSIPSKPVTLRFTHRDDTTVTLVWEAGEGSTQGHNVAYELQWRERGKSISEWNTSPTLIVSLSCRKKNLKPSTCYDFRLRAASAFGWSGYSECVKVMTCSVGNNEGAGGGGGGGGTRTPPAGRGRRREELRGPTAGLGGGTGREARGGRR